MRVSCLTLTLFGCVGGANLGQDRAIVTHGASRDGGDDMTIDTANDAASSATRTADGGLSVRVSLTQVPDTCGGCFVLTAMGPDPQVPYTFSWDDGSTEARRRVCPGESPPYRVTLRDPTSLASASSSFVPPAFPNLCTADAGAPLAPLCVSNGGFEQAPTSIGPILSRDLGAAPWQVCGTPPNFPQVLDANMAGVFMLPQPSEGRAYLSLSGANQISEALCAPIAAGTSFSFRLDVAHNSGATQADTSNPVLEIWGGPAAVCAPAELLWSSPAPLTSTWHSFCGTVTPQQPMGSITLRANVSGALPSPYEILVDHLQAVAACSP